MKAKTSPLLLAVVALDITALAQSTWDGGGADALWSNPLNWAGDVAPLNFSPLTFDGTLNLNSTNDIVGFNATGITFAPTAGQFVLGGEGIVLSGNLTNASAVEQKLNFNSFFLSGNSTIDTGSGGINISAPVTASGGTLVTKNGNGTLKFTNNGFNVIADSAGGAFTQNAGTVIFDGGELANYQINGECWIGATADQNVTAIVNSGALSISTWLAVARGNGTGDVSSDLVLNGSASITTANLSVGYNVNNAAFTPKGSITLNGTSSITATNNGNLFHISESAGSNTVIRLNDSSRISHTGGGNSLSRIGVLGKAVLNIASPNATANFNRLHFGAGANGAGAIWNRGILTVASAASTDHFALGQAAGAYGYYLHDTATPVALQEVGVGGAGGGNGVLEVRSGTLNIGQWITINRGGNATGSMVLVSGGTLIPPDISGRYEPNWSTTADQYAITDVGPNGRILGGANAQISVERQGRAGNVGLLTIHGGGVIETPRITGATGSTTVVNFDNGTLIAKANDAAFIGNVFDAVLIHAGGATFNTNGFNSTIPATLAAPTGNGVTSVPLTTGGTGYIGRPIVQLVGGGGIGATAIANFDEVTGAITGITVTSPGTGYVSAPSVVLIGGGGTGASAGAVTIAPVSSGGITKTGNGTLTLSAANGYTGGTIVNGGTLSVTNVAGSGTGTGPVTVNTGGALGGTGIVAGAVTINAGGGISPGAGIGTLTLSSVTINTGSLLNFEITNETSLDRLNIIGANGLTIGGAGLNLYVPGSTTTFSANGIYNLIGYTGTLGGAGLAGLSVLNTVPGKTYSFSDSGGLIKLTISTLQTANFWNIDADGSWNTGTNWSQGTAPNSAGAIASFGGGGVPITQPRTVTVTAPQTVGSINFNSAQSFTVAGTSTLTLNNDTVPNAEITVASGSHTISAPLNVVSGNTQVTVVNAADTLTLSGAISGTTTLSKLGNGTLVLSGANTFTGASTIFAGALQIVDDTSFGSSITETNGTRLIITGANATITKPINFDIGSGTPAGISGAANAPANFSLNIPVGSNITISSLINVANGSAVKTGGGTLTITNPDTTTLANVGGIAYVVRDGSLVLNGGPAAVYSVNLGELAIGDATPNAPMLTLESGTLNVGTFLSVGRGTGTTGLSPRFVMNGGVLNTAQLFTGFNAGVAGYNARPVIDINNNSLVTISNTLRLGEAAGSFATLNLSGSANISIATSTQIGFGGTAVVNISGSVFVSAGVFDVGYGTNAAGNTGVGIVNQTGGTIVQGGAGGGDWRIGGAANNAGANTNDALVYGSHTISGATALMDTGGRNLQIGGTGRGVLAVRNGATVNTGSFPVVGRYPGSVGLLDVDGGIFNQTNSGTLLIVGEEGLGVLNVRGTGLVSVVGAPGGAGVGGGTGGIRLAHAATGTGILNVLGGTLQTSGIAETNGAGTSYVYLNGGTVQSNAENPSFLQGIDNVVVGPGGAIFDTGGFNIAIGQPLNAPTGSGVTSIPILDGGSGYLGQPIVQISGNGVGATAVAEVNASGVVTGITITNPGINYTTPPTVTLLGGGATVQAVPNAAIIGANITTGGLIKRGFGSLTLAAINTYTGPTVIESGTLILIGSINGSSAIDVRTDGTLDVRSIFGYAVVPGQTLKGTGTVLGTTLINGVLAPGTGIGTLNFGGDLTLAGTSNFEIAKTGLSLSADLANVTGLLAYGGALQVTASGDALAMGDSFNLFDAISFSGAFTSFALPALGPNLAWDTTLLPTDGTIVVIPEPRTAAVLLGACCSLIGLRRRRVSR